jgi:hypothetical protein
MTFNLDDLEAKAKAATPGPWKSAYVKGHAFDQVFAEVNGGDFLCDVYGKTSVDAAYIASANPATMLALTARIRELEELIDEICEYRNTVARFEPDTQEKLDAYERVRTQTAAEQ